MSVARAATLLRPRATQGALTAVNRRHSHHDSHGHAAEESVAYPAEPGFNTPLWRGTILFGLLAVGFYKFAPERGDDVYLTRYLSYLSTPRDVWARLNERHLELSQEASKNIMLQANAKRPDMHRFRHPQTIVAGSPHCNPVGAVPNTQ
ncbi:hypothetical protein CONPUDRAFT_164010 [Coniophora puteana RWD-64-598 SS2]|uniref:Uncharacterized protein n=1 Tax=Coniophora puteana (strain RWD-64-598) TaxID=741705 RepID=A0A5M3MUZ0_CONPW|nr:uncharacterized protein CONPUDRAFT_164010 [Coniophora puteana RWD-64-598 SS2]EIW82992.1 hypothetical protein CONPUDRAFT_164010 [Coniophora puteana RWD-64-598 SS2]